MQAFDKLIIPRAVIVCFNEELANTLSKHFIDLLIVKKVVAKDLAKEFNACESFTIIITPSDYTVANVISISDCLNRFPSGKLCFVTRERELLLTKENFQHMKMLLHIASSNNYHCYLNAIDILLQDIYEGN